MLPVHCLRNNSYSPIDENAKSGSAKEKNSLIFTFVRDK